MTDIDSLIQRREALRKELSSLQNKAAVAKADEDRISKEIAGDLKLLKDRFGCGSYEEATNLRDSMVKELTELCDSLEDTLSKINVE